MILKAAPIIAGVAYFIRNQESGTVLDLSGSDPDHVKIIGWPFNGGRNQQWIFEEGSPKLYKIRNVAWGNRYVSYNPPGDNPSGIWGAAVIGKDSPTEWLAEQSKDGAYWLAVPDQDPTEFTWNSLVLDLDFSGGNISVPGVGAVVAQNYDQVWQLDRVE